MSLDKFEIQTPITTLCGDIVSYTVSVLERKYPEIVMSSQFFSRNFDFSRSERFPEQLAWCL